MIILPENFRILVVDDEPDIYAITKLSLRRMRYKGKRVKLVKAETGAEAVEIMKSRPDTAVILLDVVMETETAGLDACKTIREELGNHMVRIILRTGQPGAAPEQEVIETYDIDGYLAKAELTKMRLYTAVRTGLKAFEELVNLERHRQTLNFLHEAVASLHSFEALDVTLQRILTAAISIAPASLAVLSLDTFEQDGYPQNNLLHISSDQDQEESAAVAAELAAEIRADSRALAMDTPGPYGDDGYLIPLILHRELGDGWIYLKDAKLDPLAIQALPMLATHAVNALYASVAQVMLEAREGPFFESMNI